MGRVLSGINERAAPARAHPATHAGRRAATVQLPREYDLRTIPVDREPYFPGDNWARIRAGSAGTPSGDARPAPPASKSADISHSTPPVATLYEVGLNHFFRGKDHPGGGDHVFFHASRPRACAPCRRSRRNGLDSVSRCPPRGLPSYARQLDHFWEFPTVTRSHLPGVVRPLPA